MNKPPIRIGFSRTFTRNTKRLAKKYPHLESDVEPLIEKLKNGDTPGDQVPGTGYTIYKERLPNRDAQRGQRGRYRVIYYIRTETDVIMITIYAKTEQSDIPLETIRRIIAEELEPPTEE